MKKEDMKLIISTGLMIISVIVLIFWWMPNALGAIGAEEYVDDCYQYVNTTWGVRYAFGKCYIQENSYYESNEKCGFLGISCYETSEPYYKTIRETKCITAKTGERC